MTDIINLDDYRDKEKTEDKEDVKRMDEDTLIYPCPECDSEVYHIGEGFSIHCAECWVTILESFEEDSIEFTPEEDDDDDFDS